MSRQIYWSLLGACGLLVGMYSRPAWSVVHAHELPVAGPPTGSEGATEVADVKRSGALSSLAASTTPAEESLASIERRP